MMELLLPWSSTLLDLFLALRDSCPEISSVVIGSVSAAAIHKNATIISELRHKLLPLLCKYIIVCLIPTVRSCCIIEFM